MEILKGLELVEVVYENDDKKATMTFLDEENGEIREVTFNKQDYDKDKRRFYDSPEKSEKVEEWCQTYFGCDFEDLGNCIGVKKDVYAYDRFNSLWESDTPSYDKFGKDDKGKLFQTEIIDVVEDSFAIKIHYEYNGKTYESKMTHGKYVETKKAWFENPIKKETVYKKFEEKFGVPVSEADTLVGQKIIVEVKSAFGQFFYGDVKPIPAE